MPADRTSSAASTGFSPWPHAESSIPTPCGNCWRCGGTLYEYLVHHCTTSVRITLSPFQWTVRDV